MYREIKIEELPEHGRKWLEGKIEERLSAIAKMWKESGDPPESVVIHAIRYDMEFAELTTQGDILRKIGVLPDSDIDARKASDEDVSERLAMVIGGLALIGSYIQNVDHFSDRGLLYHLQKHILAEQIRFVPPSEDMREYIDMSYSKDSLAKKGFKPVKRDLPARECHPQTVPTVKIKSGNGGAEVAR
jgi:hypothetical protein